MRKETDFIISQLNETFKGDPWFGRSITALLNEVDEEMAFIQLKKQHSILELVWHMVNWRDLPSTVCNHQSLSIISMKMIGASLIMPTKLFGSKDYNISPKRREPYSLCWSEAMILF